MTTRVIAVTGGSGSLGRAVIQAALGARLKVASIDHSAHPSAPDGVLELAGVDLTDADQAQAAVDRAVSELGGLDILVNVAGGFAWQTVDDADPAWDRLYRLNVATAVNASRAALTALQASAEGRIVNVGAAGALKAAAGMGAYAAAKSGVHSLTQALAEELKGTSVTVNAVLPSILDTDQNRRDMPDADPSKWVDPADMASVILFLASPEARAVTGALIPVTGKV